MGFKKLSVNNQAPKNCNTFAEELIKRYEANEADCVLDGEKLKIFNQIKKDLKSNFEIPWTSYTATRFSLVWGRADIDIYEELIARYTYDNSKSGRNLNTEYPPLIQIEVASICNYRCIFCYQTDESFSGPKSNSMGTMDLDRFKIIIDEIEGKVPYITFASRGEPLLNKRIDEMLEYCRGKFLDIKINTNASLLNEHLSNVLLDNCHTIVFSIDAADKENYEKMRINGRFENVVNNIKNFANIRAKHPRNKEVQVRASGVSYGNEVDKDKYEQFFTNLVDETSFVAYNPWEKIYELPENNNLTPCSQPLYRFFIWQDGTFNVCDMDYKNQLCKNTGIVGTSISVKEAWKSKRVNEIRNIHACEGRTSLEPCQRCPL